MHISYARKHYVSVVYCCALCISVILQLSVHTSGGWRLAFTRQWIKVYKPLFITYVRTHSYMSFCLHTRVFEVLSCMNLQYLQVAYTQIRPDIMWDYLDIMMVFPKQSFKRVIFKKKSGHQNRQKTIVL